MDAHEDPAEQVRKFHGLYYRGPEGVPLQSRISFLGVPLVKCPTDLWIYQEIVYKTRPEIIIECGVHCGGTTLYLASLCDLVGEGRVLACDISLARVDPKVRAHPRIELFEGSSTDPAVHGAIAERCRGLRTMVILDSDHSHAHVSQELTLYGPLVTPGCYLICEDTNVNGHPVEPAFGPGPFEAVQDFLGREAGWQVDRECERLLLTFNPSGYLLRSAHETVPSGCGSFGFLSGPGLVSIIIPCFNQLNFTRMCIDSLLRHTRPPWQLIVVNNGSTDGTAEYLRELQVSFPRRMVVITNDENLGFPKACNQGINAALGGDVVLLNDDTVVTNGWLDQLVALADSNESIGMVGPMSNYVSPPQLVEKVTYTNVDQMHQFAAHWRAQHRGQWMTTQKLSGFCLLIRRKVLEAVGGFDEGFRVGFFDDDDLAMRVRQAGFTLALAVDLFVHHWGSRTFIGENIDADSLLRENQARFEAKWGKSGDLRRVTLQPWQAESRAPTAEKGRPRVSLTMIVKNEEANLSDCLDLVKDLFDEYIIVDTGSTDCTKEIAHSFGARVFDFVWVSDFAAARNAALARATGEFVFWLDADDRLEPPERERLREFLASLCEPAAYVFRCACDPDPKGGGATVVDHIRLFPNREDIKWHYRVHEQILPSLRQAGIEVRWTDITIRHTGYVDQQLRQRKLERDLRILEEDLAERPDDPFVLFNMGSIAIEREDGRSALHYLKRSLQGSATTDSITRKLYALIARAHQMLGEPEAALRVCAQGLAVDADDAELLFRQAVLRRHMGDRAGAEASWQRVLMLKRPEKFSSVDIGIYGHLTRRNLAVLAEERADVAEALRLWSDVLAECPGDRDALAACDRLGRRFLTIPDPGSIDWLVPGSRRHALPMRGPGDFDPYMSVAEAWVRALSARVVVELGVRLGASARALLAGVHATEGHLWGVDLVEQHGIVDPCFTFVQADAAEVADRWSAIDLLHVDTDPHTEEQTLRWFTLYAAKCRAVALHDTHHPDFGVGRAVRAFLGGTDWHVYEYWGNPSGWTVLTRPGEPFPSEEASP